MKRQKSTQALQRKLQRFFSHAAISRGQAYFFDGAVMNLQDGKNIITADVIGSKIYQTAIDWSSISHTGYVNSFCSCPHFQEGNLCKHLWSLILEIDKKGLSSRIHFRQPVQMIQLTENLLKSRLQQNVNADSDQVLVSTKERPAALKISGQNWREAFQEIQEQGSKRHPSHQNQRAGIIMQPDQHNDETIKFSIYTCEITHTGQVLSPPRPVVLPTQGSLHFGDASLRAAFKTLAALALSEENPYDYRYGGYRVSRDPHFRKIKASNLQALLPGLLESVPVFTTAEDFLEFVNGKQEARIKYCQFGQMNLEVSQAKTGYLLDGKVSLKSVHSDEENQSLSINDLKKMAEPGLYRFKNLVGFWDPSQEEKVWAETLRTGEIAVPAEDTEPFLEAILNQPMAVTLPFDLQWQEVKEHPQAKVQLFAEKRSENEYSRYFMDLRFQYGPRSISHRSLSKKLASLEDQRIYIRDAEEEAEIWNQLPIHLLNSRNVDGDEKLVLSSKNLLSFVKDVLACGFPIDVENRRVQSANDFQISVSSGVDWFDVNGQAEFSGLWVKFPSLLEAIHKGESFIPLPDGSVGLMNDILRKKLEKLADFAESSKDGLRFSQAQGLLLNSLLENEENLKLDIKFKHLREKIKNFSGFSTSDPAPTFQGKLRKYQKEGLGWLEFLDSFGLGGILADDMGLGKTIQCLAFLEGRRSRQKRKRAPSLLLAPKSLLSNWQSEAQKFTPDLKMQVLAGLGRENNHEVFRQHDLVVTTYQTMLRDFEILKEMKWDCVILDEAQAIKNPEALVSKAAKCLPSNFRLAMTGTPIENSIQDLFSISDFANPGFLRGKNRTAHLKLSDDSKQMLSRAFKPVILRRTKEQVLKDLPAKTEQMITVELESKQLRAYNELKRFYQSQLLREVQDKGIKRSQIQILAALTRLRQAALHPALIDPSQSRAKSAKFEVALEMLDEVIAEGHRVLIFSQFTSLLNLFKTELGKKKIKFCYLDGKTTNRQQVVQDFKSEAHPVFLMSLKAGGVGLNLVEADYVFLLDPWWNPAAETQAIDRVHRMGQTRAVNAYRFIAKNTVEEKILELQKTKKGISSEILDGQSSLMRNLTAQDIENLLM